MSVFGSLAAVVTPLRLRGVVLLVEGAALRMMLDAMYAEETLVYCSDWPHWDWDDPATTFPKLPERLHKRVFAENARELFGL